MPHTSPSPQDSDPSTPGNLSSTTIALLQELVRNGCENDLTPDSGQEIRNADTLEKFFAGAPVTIQRVEPHPGRVTLIVTVEGTDPQAEPLTLLGHTDVVPADASAWSVDPFGAEISDGQIWGRGTVDMMSLTAAMAVVTREIAISGRPRGTLIFAGVADEEARGGLGAAWLATHRPELLDWRNCISEFGGSHLRAADGSDAVVVAVGEKGAAQRRLVVHTEPGHGSTPWHRTSAVQKIAEVALRIAKMQLPAAHDDLWRHFVTSFHFDQSTEKALITGAEDDVYEIFGPLASYAHAVSHLTVAETVVNAGKAINVIPGTASLELDIRTLPGQTDDDVDHALRTALGDLAEEVEIQHLISEEATISPTDTPLYRAIEETIGEFFPDSAVIPVIGSGGSDLRFARRLGGLGYGFSLYHRDSDWATMLGRWHATDEHIALDDVDLTVTALHRLVTRFVNPR
ncbi:MAG: M20/M25/M40 family metallo-hydrolase [Acidipropionibacterium sp.]|jgi:acetylornithine deacetylase/succinyl-diaminopimelate desuccinylase-like protein|nr:M20/M25/M40 family metallo-hydrolase [Acidipropionibacterium sp.]